MSCAKSRLRWIPRNRQVGGISGAGRCCRRRELQHPLLSTLHRSVAASTSRQALGNLFHVAGCYVQDWLFHPTDFNWRVVAEDGGQLRAVADIGTHWLDLIQFIVNQRVSEVCADLSTVYPQRSRPLGGVETFSGKVASQAATESIDVTTDDYGCVMLRFDRRSERGDVGLASDRRAARTACDLKSRAPSNRSPGTASRPTKWKSDTATRPMKCCFETPPCSIPVAAAATSYPGGHNEGFGDTFKQLFIDFYGAIESGDYQRATELSNFCRRSSRNSRLRSDS